MFLNSLYFVLAPCWKLRIAKSLIVLQMMLDADFNTGSGNNLMGGVKLPDDKNPIFPSTPLPLREGRNSPTTSISIPKYDAGTLSPGRT